MNNGRIRGGAFHRGLAAAVRFLFPMGETHAPLSETPSAVRWVVPIGLLIGLAWAGMFRATWRIFDETSNMRVMPALAVTLLECLLTGPYLVMGLARTVHLLTRHQPRQAPHDPLTPLSPVGTLTLALAVLCQWVLVVSIRDVQTWWPLESDWRHYFNFLYPRAIYRPLILAPLWGRWGILLAATIGRTARHADGDTVALAGAMRPSRLLWQSLLPIALTAIYCSREHNRFIGVVLAMLVFAATFLVAFGMGQRGGGQTRQSLFAAGQVSQLAFLTFYQAFWRTMHG